jgi:hypothetical protein
MSFFAFILFWARELLISCSQHTVAIIEGRDIATFFKPGLFLQDAWSKIYKTKDIKKLSIAKNVRVISTAIACRLGLPEPYQQVPSCPQFFAQENHYSEVIKSEETLTKNLFNLLYFFSY